MNSSGARHEITSQEMSQYSVCVLLGSAGTGKTHELKFLKDYESQRGNDVQFLRLAELSAAVLQTRLKQIVESANQNSILYIDAVDEAMIPIPTVCLNLCAWIKEEISGSLLRIRISCRSAVWPSQLTAALNETREKGSFVVATLQPLSFDEIQAVVAAHDVDAKKFITELERGRVLALAEQPFTLKMLIRVFSQDGQLLGSRNELLKRGIEILSTEPHERREMGTATPFSSQQIIDAAENLACLSLFSGRETIDLTNDPPANTLGLMDLTALERTGFSDPLLCAIGKSGLCEGIGPNFQFAHRQIAEYLAGRRARAPFLVPGAMKV